MTPNECIEYQESNLRNAKEEVGRAHKNYSKWLRSSRKVSGISLRDLAIQVGISAPYLSDIERGNRNASSRVREAINRILSPSS